MLTFFRVNFRIVFFCISLIVILFSTSTRALNCTNQTDYVTLFCAVTVQNDEFGDSGKVWQWGHWSKRGEVFREQLICCLSLSLKCGARRGSGAEDWKSNDKPENCSNKIIIIKRNIFSGRRWSVRVTCWSAGPCQEKWRRHQENRTTSTQTQIRWRRAGLIGRNLRRKGQPQPKLKYGEGGQDWPGGSGGEKEKKLTQIFHACKVSTAWRITVIKDWHVL